MPYLSFAKYSIQSLRLHEAGGILATPPDLSPTPPGVKTALIIMADDRPWQALKEVIEVHSILKGVWMTETLNREFVFC
jgi:hypothetical protein